MTERINIDLGDGVIAQVEVLETGREKASTRGMTFDTISKAVTKISQIVSSSIQAAKPSKAMVKYGIEIGIEQGSLVAALVRGSGTANLEITLEWENKESPQDDQIPQESS